MKASYGEDFFEANVQGSLRSARVVVPVVMQMVQAASVIDVGCGLGAWLQAFVENGVSEVRGLDGRWVDQSRLLIDPERFTPVDLSRPVAIAGSYDLAVCLEVVEHLPARNNREIVRMLTGAAPVVLFSSAIPGQGGARHINEQWPCYWRELFAQADFEMLDPIRPRIMRDEQVKWWYRQNIVMFASRSLLRERSDLRALADAAAKTNLEWVHVEVLARYRSLGLMLRAAPAAVWRVISRRILHRDQHVTEGTLKACGGEGSGGQSRPRKFSSVE
jgi:SAM-dependent methyltransferase